MLAPSGAEAHEPIGSPGQPDAQHRRPGLTPVSLFLVLLIAYVLVKIQLVLVLTLLALLFATIIERPVQELERRRVPRSLSILFVYIGIVGSIVLLSISLAPVIADEASRFKEEAPEQLRELEQSWSTSRSSLLNGPGEDMLDRAIEAIEDPPTLPQEATLTVVTGVGGGIVGLMTVLVMAFYYLMEKSLLRRLILMELQPTSRARVSRIWDNVEAQVGRWLRGQLTLCLIIGATATIGYGLMGIRFWPLLGLWAGITEIIPIVGPWLGGIPAVIIAMTQSWHDALIVTIFIVALQTTENTILVPRIMRGAVGLTPLTVFVAILAGTAFMNVVGALLAIPVAAAVQVVITDYLNARREANRTLEPPMPGWRWMRGHLVPHGPESTMPEPSEVARRGNPASPPSAGAATETVGWTGQLLARVTGHGQEGRSETAAPEPDGPNGNSPGRPVARE